MEENGTSFVAFGLGVFIGAILGAVIALLFAPEAGEELRSKIQSSAGANLERTNLELNRLKQTIQEKASQAEG
jgi:gas vesicle protein